MLLLELPQLGVDVKRAAEVGLPLLVPILGQISAETREREGEREGERKGERERKGEMERGFMGQFDLLISSHAAEGR